jgi:hypothetical protein
MRLRKVLLVALVLSGLHACAPFEAVPGDVCNDATLNYSPEFAYECNQSG